MKTIFNRKERREHRVSNNGGNGGARLRRALILLLPLAFSALFAVNCAAQNKVTASITVTNKTTNGMTFTVNGSTRTWTNNVFNSAIHVLTNADVTGSGSKTNLIQHIYATPFSQVQAVDTGSNTFNLVGNANVAMSVTVSAGYASVSYSTQTVSSVIALQGPVSSLPTPQARTNNASAIVGAANAPENTNAISQNSLAVSELMGLTNGQTVSGVKVFTNALGQWFGILTNSPGISGTIIALTGGLIANTTISNAQSISGTIGTLHDGVVSNSTMIWVGGGSTNATITSDGIGLFNLALGVISGNKSPFLFGDVLLDGTMFCYVVPYGTNAPILLYQLKTNGVVYNVPVTYPSATVSSNLVVNGSATIATNLSIAGGLTVLGPQTNGAFTGTNNFLANSDIAFTAKTVSSLANGNNSAVPIGTNVNILVTGPSAAFAICGIASGRDGKIIWIKNKTGQTMTFANQSGNDPTAANRIRTGTGADYANTNNPGIVELVYDSADARWDIKSHN